MTASRRKPCHSATSACHSPDEALVFRGALGRHRLHAGAARNGIAVAHWLSLLQIAREMKAARIDPVLCELLGLSLLALGGCVLALSQGDLLFAISFAAACAVATIEAIRRSR